MEMKNYVELIYCKRRLISYIQYCKNLKYLFDRTRLNTRQKLMVKLLKV